MKTVLILGLAVALAVAGGADAKGQRHSGGSHGGGGRSHHAMGGDGMLGAPGLDAGLSGGGKGQGDSMGMIDPSANIGFGPTAGMGGGKYPAAPSAPRMHRRRG